jgi:magnesium transporter
MARFIKKQQREIGVSRDDYIFIGEKKLENVILRIVDYDKNFLEETLIDTVEEAFVYQEKKINNLV